MAMRKVFDLDHDTLTALACFAQDSGRTMDDLAAEAFTLLLRKHCRPKGLQEALRFSLRAYAPNDNECVQKKVR